MVIPQMPETSAAICAATCNRSRHGDAIEPITDLSVRVLVAPPASTVGATPLRLTKRSPSHLCSIDRDRTGEGGGD
jgi:hypothetical protein